MLAQVLNRDFTLGTVAATEQQLRSVIANRRAGILGRPEDPREVPTAELEELADALAGAFAAESAPNDGPRPAEPGAQAPPPKTDYAYLASDEPLLPWEIMLPSRPRPGAPDEDLGAALGAAFAVGRWVRGDASSPPQLLPVRDAFLIAPGYEQAEQQLDPSAELRVLEEHFGGVRLAQEDLPRLDAFLAGHAASLLHFVCHGAAEGDDSVIFLKDFAPCPSAQMRESDGSAPPVRRGCP